MNALVYVEHRPEHSLGKKSEEDLQCSPQSWLDDFIQPFLWRSSLVQALDFVNKLFVPGVQPYNDSDYLGISFFQNIWKVPREYSLVLT